VEAHPSEGQVKEEGDALLDEQPSPEPEPPTETEAPVDPEAPPVEPSDAERAGQYLALAQRTQADFENFRKRAAREVRAAEARGVSRAARELLPALDHLALALDNLDGPALEGISLVQRELLGVLGRLGIEAYSPKGEAFDPQVHEAVSQVAVEGVEPGTVFEVMQNGYKHGETVLRPARVVVAG